MSEKTKLSDYTENEFLALIIEIHRANLEEPDHVLGGLLDHFSKITEHPSGYDLLYRPNPKENGRPEKVLEIVKQWRLANGKDGFKPS
ncbi:colicin immunity protein [Pseudomonas sp. LB-090624]|uniref:bacteriocin immunity protein n=1 Tax=Pseudomonas sp. LB-090624 TaxID=2213079 RepID=UPI000D9DCEC7|nr:bacteriocin immunity protein [Pseudomonas sp. LB-090624]PYB81917.1 colicin immunity protein [Pseudomonas sp. LB-090624]